MKKPISAVQSGMNMNGGNRQPQVSGTSSLFELFNSLSYGGALQCGSLCQKYTAEKLRTITQDTIKWSVTRHNKIQGWILPLPSNLPVAGMIETAWSLFKSAGSKNTNSEKVLLLKGIYPGDVDLIFIPQERLVTLGVNVEEQTMSIGKHSVLPFKNKAKNKQFVPDTVPGR